MSNFRVVVKGSGASGPLSADGYANVVSGIILDATGYAGFNGGGNPQRPTKLIAAANAGGSSVCDIYQDDTNGGRELVVGGGSGNCLIKNDEDGRVNSGGNSKSRVSVPRPPTALNVGQLSYLDEYLEVLVDQMSDANTIRPKAGGGYEYVNDASSNPALVEKTRKVMLGMMMLTRCR